ncbi:MAG: tryptophan-rich sensory protein [Anaerolineae bacterium]|nr:MAG: tryptophan-rich sensory protein [Anaerolineae bacterium]
MQTLKKYNSVQHNQSNRLRAASGFVFWVGLCFFAAFIGGLATDTGTDSWYDHLDKPSWNPPNWVFGPVWTFLYAAMGIAAWLVWYKAGSFDKAQLPLSLFIIQLVLNTFWSLIFFGAESPGWAFVEITFLWTAIVATAISFWQYSRTSSALMIPYIAWVTFAAALNFAVWQLN